MKLINLAKWPVGTPTTAPGHGWCPHQPFPKFVDKKIPKSKMKLINL